MMLSWLRISKLLTVVVLVAAIASAAIFFVTREEEVAEPFDRTRDTQAIIALELDKEIVLMSATTTGIHEVENHRKVFGDRRMWGSGKSELIEYRYKSKLGISGDDVIIRSKLNNRYEIVIPEFEFIGYDDVVMGTVHEERGWLSFGTEDIDTGEVVTQIMDSNKVGEIIDDNRQSLERQTEDFFWDLILEIDDEVDLDFTYK